MYKATIRAMLRRNIRLLNQGNYEPLRKMAAPDAELAFPGDNSWSRRFRPVQRSRVQHTTHRGVDELEDFAQRFVAAGLQIEVEDILVNGPPWRTRICLRGTDGSPDGVYCNRVCALIETRWGRITRWEDYLDTERVAAWDRHVAQASAAAEVPDAPEARAAAAS